MNKKERDMLRRYREGNCTPAEREAVDAWYEALNGEVSALDDRSEHDLKQRHWAAISQHIPEKHVAASRRISPGYWSRAAAVLLVLVALPFLIKQEREFELTLQDASSTKPDIKVFENRDYNVASLILPDGSHVKVHPGTKLSYDADFTNHRNVYLDGEAFFDVTRDESRPFLVYTGEVITRVLGTSFAVQAYKNAKDVTVAVTSGRVSVSAPLPQGAAHDKKESILRPNQKVVYDKRNNTIKVTLVEQPKPVPQKEPLKPLHFEDQSAAEIFRALADYYQVEIQFDETVFEHCVLTTSISEESIYKRLDIICQALGASYTINETSIVITGNGCLP